MDPLIVPLAVVALASFGVALYAKTHQHPFASGSEGLLGQMATALDPLAPTGRVRVLGETWNAELSASAQALEIEVEAGSHVRIVAVERLHLIVEPEWYS